MATFYANKYQAPVRKYSFGGENYIALLCFKLWHALFSIYFFQDPFCEYMVPATNFQTSSWVKTTWM